MIDGTDLYPWFALLTSFGAMLLFAAHVGSASTRYRLYHDDRSAFDLLVALILLVVAIGLLVSSLASFIDFLGVDGRSEMRNVGLGIVRGAVLVGALTLWIADVRLTRANT
jgi:hypothetical protein